MSTKLVCTLSIRQIKAQFKLLIFSGRPYCPRCGYTRIRKSESRYRCPKCRRPFSLTSGTWLSGMKLPWDKLYLLLDCWLKGLRLESVVRLVNISYPSAFSWYGKFRRNVPKEAFKLSESGYYLVDETYFGWKKKGKRGRGSQGRKPVFGILDPTRGNVYTEVVANVSENMLVPIIKCQTPLGSTIVSDGWRSYENLEDYGYRHIVIDHDIEFKRTNQMEACWSHLKRNFRKMYHHCQLKNLPDYGREISYRFCARKNPDSPLKYLQKSIKLVPNSLH
jgi:transposase